MAQLASAGYWKTTITLINTGTAAAAARFVLEPEVCDQARRPIRTPVVPRASRAPRQAGHCALLHQRHECPPPHQPRFGQKLPYAISTLTALPVQRSSHLHPLPRPIKSSCYVHSRIEKPSVTPCSHPHLWPSRPRLCRRVAVPPGRRQRVPRSTKDFPIASPRFRLIAHCSMTKGHISARSSVFHRGRFEIRKLPIDHMQREA